MVNSGTRFKRKKLMTKAKRVFLAFVLASSVLISCHSHYRSTAYSYVIPKQLSDGLPVDADVQ